MELFFLAMLFFMMAYGLTTGFPVAFTLPGAAIITILIAGSIGYLATGDSGAYFIHDGPVQWLTAGVTNFRGIYWEVERDTLIAIPLFIFMGIMLQRSRVAEDLLVTMAQLFGSIPGGLGISVVFVGALLAATTGIVGATVAAMGLISLPVMLRNNYSKSLAAGTICASGTLGQIIPPSIVLIILADQLASASDQAASARKALYKHATGDFSMPSHLDIVSTSAGDMFLGAFIPGLVLVGLYMAYILISALLRPHTAPPVPYNGKLLDRRFIQKVLLALIPPLALMFIVLGSIITGVATVNQAGAIGGVGAMIMAGYRLAEGKKNTYYPAILAVVSLVFIMLLVNIFTLNLRAINTAMDAVGIVLALVAVAGFISAVIWSGWRVFKINNTLYEVMVESAKTTSMVFIILLGAAMLIAAFRGFGGEEIVKHFLTGLPGGFWAQFIVVMMVVFLLGFFLDFIEIAVVVVPIVSPILLADPSANVTAVWLGVMIGLNIQTSFLTPPFGFALFYLRGVASSVVKTLDIYRGVIPFIALQLIGLMIVGYYPSLVNYLPVRTYLTSDNAPPPRNPRLQACLEDYLFSHYLGEKAMLMASANRIAGLDLSGLPDDIKGDLAIASTGIASVVDLVHNIKNAEQGLADRAVAYKPIHTAVRRIERDIRRNERQIKQLTRDIRGVDDGDIIVRMKKDIAVLEGENITLLSEIPENWLTINKDYAAIRTQLTTAERRYRKTVDNAYLGLTRSITALTVDSPKSGGVIAELTVVEAAIRNTIGLRQQPRLTKQQAVSISGCLAKHRDISLQF